MSFLLCVYSICCNKLIIKLYYPHSKCGERVTAPWVRIPVSPHCDENQFIMYTMDKLILFFIADNLRVSLL